MFWKLYTNKWLWGQMTPLCFGVELEKTAQIFYRILFVTYLGCVITKLNKSKKSQPAILSVFCLF